jgi:hypothetical protein
LDDGVVIARGDIDRQGKADALIAAAARGNHRVDADHLAVVIQQRAARVAGVDGGIGLDEALELLGDVAAERADDARRDRGLQAERRADGNRPVAHLHAVRVGDPDRRQRVAGVDFDDRDVGFGVRADQLGFVFCRIVGQFDFDVIGVLHHMQIREDVAVAVYDEAGAGSFLLVIRRLLHRALLAEEAVEQVHVVVALVVALRCAAFLVGHLLRLPVGGDVDHRGLDGLGDFHEFVVQFVDRRNRQRRRVGHGRLSSRRMEPLRQQGAHDNNGAECEHQQAQRGELLPADSF